MWSEHSTGLVRQLLANGTASVLHRLPPPIYDLKLVSAAQEEGITAPLFQEFYKNGTSARGTSNDEPPIGIYCYS